jgi:hypothetical protein
MSAGTGGYRYAFAACCINEETTSGPLWPAPVPCCARNSSPSQIGCAVAPLDGCCTRRQDRIVRRNRLCRRSRLARCPPPHAARVPFPEDRPGDRQRQRSRRSDGLKPNPSSAPRLDRTRANVRPQLRQAPNKLSNATSRLGCAIRRPKSRNEFHAGSWQQVARICERTGGSTHCSPRSARRSSTYR